ncbi:unnamed protein product [Menidia menidia]|uniref:(Atlantic silverside) hypothetical protein n=1 Tax=Menidia menidia TaxID=238744 RepID=A0A8S4AQU0_9TELE|nr:unnamed protein product [Menidia menidia]
MCSSRANRTPLFIQEVISLPFEKFPAVMEKRNRQLTPAEDALEHIVACRDKPFLEQHFIDSYIGTHLCIKCLRSRLQSFLIKPEDQEGMYAGR